MIPSTSGLYMIGGAIIYFYNGANITNYSAAFKYFCAVTMIALLQAIACGTIGFFSAYAFVKRVYQNKIVSV